MDSADVTKEITKSFLSIGARPPEAFIAHVDKLASYLPSDDRNISFHQACARDSCGRSAEAIPYYRQALDSGITGENRRRAVIQMASSMRNIGQADEAPALLLAEKDRESDHLDDALTCVIGLCLSSLSRDKEGLGAVLVALAKHLPRYNVSMANYGKALLPQE